MSIPFYARKRSMASQVLHIDTYVIPNIGAGNAAADIITEDAIIEEIVILNFGGQAAPQVTVQDKQGTPRPFAFGVSTIVGAGTGIMFESDGSASTGGLNISCDTTNALTAKISWRRPLGN